MNPIHPGEKILSGAAEAGELDTGPHAGKPLPPMRANNPGWWISAFLERERLPDRLRETAHAAGEMLDAAVGAPTLAEARAVLADRNEGVIVWNEAVPEEYHLAVIEETELLTMRQSRT